MAQKSNTTKNEPLRGDRAQLLLLNKILGLDVAAATNEQLRISIATLLRAGEFKKFLRSPREEFPVAAIPERLRGEFKKCRLLMMTERVASKMSKRHADVSVGDFEMLPQILAEGVVFKDSDHGEFVRVFFRRSRNGTWWRLVACFPAEGLAARIVTFHKSTKRAFLKINAQNSVNGLG